jgi:arylsulfatase
MMMFASDNGATYEGGEHGSTQYWGTTRNILRGERVLAPTDLAEDYGRRDLIGGPRAHCHYPRGWGMVGNAPFRLYKGTVLAGGHQVPLIFSWPRGVEEHGTFRSQYVHVTDILPTLLELVGLDAPTERHGQPVKTMTGTSFVSVLRDLAAPPVHREQYYESRGHRGFYQDGWEAATVHEPRTHFRDDDWQLFHLDEDPTESENLAAQHPGTVKQLAEAWEDAAWENQVFPLDEGSGLLYALVPPYRARMLEPVTIYPGTPTLERYRSSVLIGARSFTVDVRVEFSPGDEGILLAHGDQCGGYAFYVEDDELVYVHNGYGEMQSLRVGRLEPGARAIRAEFTTIPDWNWQVTVLIDGNAANELASVPMLWGVVPCEGIDIGIDRRSPVSWEIYERHGAFPYTGQLSSVTYTPGDLAAYAPALSIDQLRALGRQFD